MYQTLFEFTLTVQQFKTNNQYNCLEVLNFFNEIIKMHR